MLTGYCMYTLKLIYIFDVTYISLRFIDSDSELPEVDVVGASVVLDVVGEAKACQSE